MRRAFESGSSVYAPERLRKDGGRLRPLERELEAMLALFGAET